ELDRRKPHAARRRADHDVIVDRSIRALDDRERREVLHPDRRTLDRRKPRRRRNQAGHRDDRLVAPNAVRAEPEIRHHANRVSGLPAGDAGPDLLDRAVAFVADARRQLRLHGIAAGAEHRLGAVEPDRLHANTHLAFARRADLLLLDLEHLGSAELAEHHDSCHCFTPSSLEPAIAYRPAGTRQIARPPPTPTRERDEPGPAAFNHLEPSNAPFRVSLRRIARDPRSMAMHASVFPLRFAAVAAFAIGASTAVAQPAAPTPLGEGPWVIETETHKVRVSVLTRDLQSPWSLVFLPNGDMLVTERPGRRRVIRDGKLDPTPIEGLPEIVGESIGGLMGLALHPDFERNRLI